MRLQRVALAGLLTQSRTSVLPEPEVSYKEVTLRQMGGGAVVRREVEGSNLAGRRWVAKQGQFVVSKIDARNGSMAIVPPELDGALVTNDFPLFDVNRGVLASEYLRWLCRSPAFVQMCVRASRGTTNRKRLKESVLLSLEVAIPDLKNQLRIAHQLDSLQLLASRAAEHAADVVRLSEELLQTRFAAMIEHSPRKRFGEIAPVVRRSVAPAQGELFPEIGIRSFGRGTFHKTPLDFWELGGKRIFRIEKGDLLLSNVFAWEGAIAVAGPRDHGLFGSHRFITCVPEQGVADARFLRYYLLGREGLSLVRKASPGGAGRNRTLGLKRLADIPVPVPAFEEQLEFVGALSILEQLVGRRDQLAQLDKEVLDAAVREWVPRADTVAGRGPSVDLSCG